MRNFINNIIFLLQRKQVARNVAEMDAFMAFAKAYQKKHMQ